jgi:hypothetical protein
MSWRVVGLVSYPVIAAVVGISSTVVLQTMVDEVNHKRPPEDRISSVGWDPDKLARVVNLYREAYPSGRRHIRLAILFVIGALGFLIAALCFFLPS